MNKPKTRKQTSGALACIVMILVLSGLLRAGGVGLAVASESESPPRAQPQPAAPEMTPDTRALLDVIKERTAQLDAKERELLDRSHSLEAAEQLIKQNLTRLAEAEERLQASIARVDGASEDDLARLTAVYESMKPKVASLLFEEMRPEFAAGFMARMTPQAAANIMSGLSSDTGYAISVVLAGRNANAPKQ